MNAVAGTLKVVKSWAGLSIVAGLVSKCGRHGVAIRSVPHALAPLGPPKAAYSLRCHNEAL